MGNVEFGEEANWVDAFLVGRGFLLFGGSLLTCGGAAYLGFQLLQREGDSLGSVWVVGLEKCEIGVQSEVS